MNTTKAGRIIAPRNPITGRREATYGIPSYVRETLYVLEGLIVTDDVLGKGF